ncbi:MAG: LytTR family DNA-binding domain-containing protein [Syntrophomonas sp.]|nr:LytTR family DNA-binding domain-containing protein [Syntrophomonas sp.]
MSTVLILEDEKWTLEFLEVFVSKHPMVESVFAVNNSQDAIETAQKHLPDIALLDIELKAKDTINGIQTAKMIASVSPATVLVFVTGYGKYAPNSFVVHPYDYLLKPIRKDKLTDIITELSVKTNILGWPPNL